MDIDPALLQRLPFGLMVQDADGRIEWINETLRQMLALPEDAVLGRTVREVPAEAQRLLAPEPRLLEVGNDQRWVRRDAFTGSDGVRLLVVTDVSVQEQLAAENARLRQQVEALKLTDDLTGLPNKRAISQALDLHISRSRRYHNPLSVLMVRVTLQSPDGVSPLSTEPVILGVSRFLRDRLRWVDQIGRWEDELFLLVLPETTDADARALRDKIATEQDSIEPAAEGGGARPWLDFGLACWSKGDDMRTLLRTAVRDLAQSSTG